MKEFATNLKVPSIYVNPRVILKSDRARIAGQLSKILGVSRSFVAERLSRDKAFVWLKRRTSIKEAEAITKLSNPAFGISYESKRFYPHGELLSNVIGFCNVDTARL